MNYFGHAALATFRGGGPRFVLGAMLPDFYSMIGARSETVSDPQLALGITFHLETDALFHQSKTFIALNQLTLQALRKLGVSRGPARACAHMGVEMLIDAVLIREQVALEGYLDALRIGMNTSTRFAPQPLGVEERLRRLCAELSERAETVHSTSRERFAFRLGHALRERPRLCPSEDELEAIAQYLSKDGRVEQHVPELLSELQPLFETKTGST